MVNELLEYDLRVGVTGHRDVLPNAIPAIEKSVEATLEALGRNAGRKVFLSSLAEGADQIAAEVAVRLGYDLQVPLPFERQRYTAGFPRADKERYERLESLAVQVFIVPPVETDDHGLPSRDWLYRQAGLFIANECDVLLALWDGCATTGAMCGTADIINYLKRLNGKHSANPLKKRPIIQIATPRLSSSKRIHAGEIKELSTGLLDLFDDMIAFGLVYNLDAKEEFNL